MLATAAAPGSTIEATTAQLAEAPSANTVRNHLKRGLPNPNELAGLEAQLNALLATHVPPRLLGYAQRVAIDLVLLPHYGQPAQAAKELWRSAAKDGTTHFRCYGTALVIKHHKRVTLAVTYVQADDSLLAVLERLLARLQALQVGPAPPVPGPRLLPQLLLCQGPPWQAAGRVLALCRHRQPERPTPIGVRSIVAASASKAAIT